MQIVNTDSDPTNRGLSSLAAEKYAVFWIPSNADCQPRMQPVYRFSDHTYRGLKAQGADCSYDSNPIYRDCR